MSNWLFRLLIFLSILVSGSIYPIIFGGVVPTLVILFISLVLLGLKRKYKRSCLTLFSNRLILIVVILFLQFFLTGLNNQDNEFIKFLFRVFAALAVLLCYRIYERDAVEDFSWVMNLILIHSILNFFLGFFIMNYLSVVDTEQLHCFTFKYVFFYFSEGISSGINFLRNQSIFWEPGVLAVFLNLYLFTLLFVKRRLPRASLVFFIILTTFSTTGLVLAVIQFALKYGKRVLKSSITLVMSFLFLVIISPIVIENINDKVSGDGEGSFIMRSFDMLVSFQIIAENPVKGIGFGGEVYKRIQEKNVFFMQSDFSETRGNTNSVIYIFVAFGIPLATYILYILYNQKVWLENEKGKFFFIIIVCLATEPLITTVFFLVIVLSGLILEKPSISYGKLNNQLQEW